MGRQFAVSLSSAAGPVTSQQLLTDRPVARTRWLCLRCSPLLLNNNIAAVAMPEAKEADQMFVLMTAKYRVSRNTRAQWFFNQIKKVAETSCKEKLEDFTEEIEIVSMLPSNYQDLVDEDEDHRGPFLITQNTKVTFLARRYRLVFVLDLSPSMTTVDIQSNKVLYDEIFTALSRSLKGLAQPFYVPGSRLLFQPDVFVSVLAHTPFFTTEGEQVVAQGWKLTADNATDFLALLKSRFDSITAAVSKVTAAANDELEEKRKNPDSLNLDSLFDDQEKPSSCLSIPADIAMVNMYRSGLLSLQLLPPQSNAGLVLISDGMLTLPNASVLESMLTQSRNHNISCSFLQVGSSPHPHACFGYLPYTDLMKFITTATFGAYLDKCPDEPEPLEFNYTIYHRAFLAWNFQRGLHGFKSDVHWDEYRNQNRWAVNNPYFYSANDQVNRFPSTGSDQKKDQQMVKNKLTKSRVANSFTSVLSCRLREGYTIKSVNIYPSTSQIEVTLVLPWKHNVNIEYALKAPWSSKTTSTMYDPEPFECYYEVSFEGSYWFLHDVTCLAKNKKIRSSYRRTAIQQFWTTLKNLSEADKFLAHLNSFSRKNGMEVPESVKKSGSLFVLSPNSSELILSSENSAYQQFASYWKHICLLDITVWHKWMHTHRINLMLKHDLPLPKHLHEADAGGRFFHIQCLKAMTALSHFLKEYSTFVMLENHSYIRFIQIPANNSQSFFMIRLTTLLPSVVLHVAFIGGTPGDLRHKIIDELKAQLKECKFECKVAGRSPNESGKTLAGDKSTPFCVLMRKPIEKIMIRYGKVPSDFSASFESYLTSSHSLLNAQPKSSSPSKAAVAAQASADTLATLGRHMHHKRWLWVTREVVRDSKLLSTVLSSITKKRLSEGFHFAYNKMGMINMVLEIDMIVDGGSAVPCVMQYILFPPQNGPSAGKEASSDHEVVGAGDDVQHSVDYGQIITEYWIEPQVGESRCIPSGNNSYLDGKTFWQIGDAIFEEDRALVDPLAVEPLVEELAQSITTFA